MKKIFFIAVLLFYSCNSFAQTPMYNTVDNLFIKKNLLKYSLLKNSRTVWKQQKHSAINLMGQNIAGIAGGALIALPIYSLATSDDFRGTNAREYLGILSIIGYMVGSATGVVEIANLENPNISFWGTVGYSAIGGSIGLIVLGRTFDGDDLWPGAIILGLVLPTFTSMIYSEFVADWPDEAKNLNLQPKLESHKDLIEQSKLFNIELVRIQF